MGKILLITCLFFSDSAPSPANRNYHAVSAVEGEHFRRRTVAFKFPVQRFLSAGYGFQVDGLNLLGVHLWLSHDHAVFFEHLGHAICPVVGWPAFGQAEKRKE